ncbi:hypothetical protein NQ317_017023 [Molorchus minor]|uniref:Uncharacterized protein n=1 Tax=Molorchus minor TaxID=1323400 RepID=A0ABQ9JAS8_9CUCU|nr:hypothetical protein NQ317_017023 [Molorchus minor]
MKLSIIAYKLSVLIAPVSKKTYTDHPNFFQRFSIILFRLKPLDILCTLNVSLRDRCPRQTAPCYDPTMGDTLLKQKPPRGPQWHQSAGMLPRKPFPPIYQNHRIPQRNSFSYHTNNPVRWREGGGFYPLPRVQFPADEIEGSLLPRAVLPERDAASPNPSRLLMVDPRKKLGAGGSRSVCQCRSKSMEDVRTEVVEVANDRWRNDVNGNRVAASSVKNGDRLGRYLNRRSMENLLVDTRYSPPGSRTASKQVDYLLF